MVLALLSAVLGGLLVAGIRAAYGVWVIVDGGGAALLNETGAEVLAFDVLGLHRYALAGALVGLAVGVLVVIQQRRVDAARVLANSMPAASSAREQAPDDKLLAIQRETAERYLREKRKQRLDKG